MPVRVDTRLMHWNNGSGNVSCTQTGTTAAFDGATLAGSDAADGTCRVVLDGSQIALKNLTINANDCAGSGSTFYQP